MVVHLLREIFLDIPGGIGAFVGFESQVPVHALDLS